MAKEKVSQDEKFEKQDFDLFAALSAIDKKDYGWFSKLTDEQKKKFVPYMLVHWVSAVQGSKDLQQYYLQSLDYHANKYLFNEHIQRHPELQWLMLCAASPGIGKPRHQWIPHIREKVNKLKEQAKSKEIRDYFTKIYSGAKQELINELADEYVKTQKRKMYLAEVYPNLKLTDIETLNELITDEQIKQYEQDRGNS